MVDETTTASLPPPAAVQEPAAPAISTDEAPAAVPRPDITRAPPPRRRGSGGWWVALALLALLGAGGYFAWTYQRSLTAQLDAQQRRGEKQSAELARLTAEVTRLDERQGDVQATGQRAATQIAEFASRLESHDQMMGRLTEDLQGGRARLQLSVTEHLLLLANDRLQLARDVPTALAALDAADDRLARLADPRLFNVRKAIADERALLMAVPQPDRASAALTLSSLVGRVSRLPLAARVPDRFESQDDAEPPVAGNADTWTRLRASVRRAVSSMFSVRRNSGPAPRLLSTQGEALVMQILALKLEGARSAWLAGDAVSFRDLLESSQQWLRDYFRTEDPGVLAAQAELERLRALELAPPLPDISRSLSLLRAHLDAESL